MRTYAHVCSRMLYIQVIHIIPTSVPVVLLQGEEVRGEKHRNSQKQRKRKRKREREKEKEKEGERKREKERKRGTRVASTTRQHTSAYVSMCQRASAYVSIHKSS